MRTELESDVIQAMITYGGGFASQLGLVCLNTDHGRYMIVELTKALGLADDTNTQKVILLLTQTTFILEQNENDRLQMIRDLWPEIWDRYQQMVGEVLP